MRPKVRQRSYSSSLYRCQKLDSSGWGSYLLFLGEFQNTNVSLRAGSGWSLGSGHRWCKIPIKSLPASPLRLVFINSLPASLDATSWWGAWQSHVAEEHRDGRYCCSNLWETQLAIGRRIEEPSKKDVRADLTHFLSSLTLEYLCFRLCATLKPLTGHVD